MSTSSLPCFIKIHPAVLEKKSKMWKVYGRTDRRTDDGRCAMTIAHSSLRLKWAKNIFLSIGNNTGTNLRENIKDYQMVTTYAQITLNYTIDILNIDRTICLVEHSEIGWRSTLKLNIFTANHSREQFYFAFIDHRPSIERQSDDSRVYFWVGRPSADDRTTVH